MKQNTTNNNESLKPIVFDAKKAMQLREASIKVADKIKADFIASKGLSLVPTFGGTEIVTALAFIQSVSQTTEKAKYEVSKHFIQVLKGGTKTFVPVMDGEQQAKHERTGAGLYDIQVEGGKIAYKKERILIEKAAKKDAWFEVLVNFAASDIENFNKTLGEALQVTEQRLLSKVKVGKRILKTTKPLYLALQIGDMTINTRMFDGEAIESKYLQPKTYAGKSNDEIKAIWNEFCKKCYHALRTVLDNLRYGTELSLKEAYLTMINEQTEQEKAI